MPLHELVLDRMIFPRGQVSRPHVDALMDALRTGATLPPIIADEESKRIVDGVHRYTAQRNLYSPGYEVAVELRRYETVLDMFLESVKLNARHGLRLSDDDIRVCLARAASLNGDVATLAASLGVPKERLQKAVAVEPTSAATVATGNGHSSRPTHTKAVPLAKAPPLRPANPAPIWKGDDNAESYLSSLLAELCEAIAEFQDGKRPPSAALRELLIGARAAITCVVD